MKELLKKTAALWIAAAIVLLSFLVPVDFRADAASGGTAYLTVELLSMDLGFLCAPASIEIVSGETAAQTFMRYLCARGYTAYYTGTSVNNYKLGYIADGNKSEAHNGYSSSIKAYPVPNPKTISIKGELSSLTVAMLTTFGVEWDPAKDRVDISGFIGEKDLTDQSCWVFSVNNQYVTGPLSSVKLSDGDVLRVQFSLAKGRDLGYSFIADGSVKSQGPDRSKLIKLVANHAGSHSGSTIYDEAYAALCNVSLTSEDITRISGALVNELKSLNLYQAEPTTKKAEPSSATTAKAPESSSTTTTKKAETSSTTTTKKAETSSTTTTKKAETSSTTTTKKAETSSTTTTKKAETSSTTTTKASATSSNSVTAKPYTPGTTGANGVTSVLTTVLGQTTLPGETTTIERPTGIVLERVSKEVPTTEPETTEEDITDEETTAAANAFLSKLNQLRYSGGAVRNIVIVAVVVALAALAALIAMLKMRKTV